MQPIPAVVTAGDLRAAKAVYGESKVYLELGRVPLVAHVVLALQDVPEVAEVWVVGDAARLEAVMGRDEIREKVRKPLHIIDQFRNLYENIWEAYRRLLPGAPPEGRDPGEADVDVTVLYLSGDVPFATAGEISSFVQRSRELGCDYAMGLVTEESMKGFYPLAPGEPGIRMAYFNTREGRLRTSNLHLVKPGRIVNRSYIEDMYEHRHQKEFANIVSLAWTLLRKEEGGLRILGYYVLIHIAGFANRRGYRRLADRIRWWIPLARMAEACSSLLRTRFQFAITEVGGCAVDIDNEHDFDVAQLRFDEWRHAQRVRAEELFGALGTGEASAPESRNAS